MPKTQRVAKVLDGIPITLGSGRVVRCQPPTVRAARRLIEAYNRVVQPPLTESATGAEVAADEAERRAALQLLLEEFPAAVGQPELEDLLAPGDIIRLLPSFFWKGTGARLTPAPNGHPASTGTSTGASGLPPSA